VDGSAAEPLKEARHMTGTIHLADAQGDTTRTWDTADPATVQEDDDAGRAGPLRRLVGLKTLGAVGCGFRL
jgi:hypothetical protein